MTFNKFKQIIRAIGGVWAFDSIQFTQHQSYCAAHFRPSYPNDTPQDSVIVYRRFDGYWWGKGPHSKGISFVNEHD